MKIVVDSNIVFSAVMRDSKARQILLNFNAEFYFPSYLVKEYSFHKSIIAKKSNVPEENLEKLFQQVIQRGIVVPWKDYQASWDEAQQIMKKIDRRDVSFVACALLYPGSVIWSDDKGFQKQSQVRIITTYKLSKIWIDKE